MTKQVNLLKARKSENSISKIMSVQDAVSRIPSGATITVGGLISVLCPEKVLTALEERFLSTGEPRNLTVVTPVRVGWDRNNRTGLEHFAHKGMLKRLITGTVEVNEGPRIAQMIRHNEIEAYSYSMGVLFHFIQAIAGGKPGVITTVGRNTFIDPRYDGGRLNEISEESLVELISIAGEDHLFHRSFPIDVTIIRGTTADENGNISLEHEPATLGGLEMAMAAKASGGYVIAQVQRVVQNNSLHPRSVEIPGMLVDAIVIDQQQKQSLLGFDPSWTGEIRKPLSEIRNPLPLDARKIIVRRASKELEAGMIVNLGYGIPVGLPQLAIEKGFIDDITFTLEHGAIGGVPMGPEVFGAHINPTSIMSSPNIFDFYHSGGLSASLLGCAQIDKYGNVNISRFNGIFRGSGGFIDITHKTKKIMFCGTLTSGGLEISTGNGRLNIVKEGKHKKFIDQVEHLTFNANEARQKKQDIYYITERCVFRLGPDGLILTEYAPGIDIEKQILCNIDFNVVISPELKQMSVDIFSV